MTALHSDNPAFMLRKVKNVAIENIPVPKITGAHEVIVKVGQTGICG